jgi:hypothetical protein
MRDVLMESVAVLMGLDMFFRLSKVLRAHAATTQAKKLK